MRAGKCARAKAGPRVKAAAPLPPAPSDLQAVNPGLVGIEQPEADRAAGAAVDGSVEDPLQDWPEAEGEPDRWVLERGAQESEQQER